MQPDLQPRQHRLHGHREEDGHVPQHVRRPQRLRHLLVSTLRCRPLDRLNAACISASSYALRMLVFMCNCTTGPLESWGRPPCKTQAKCLQPACFKHACGLAPHRSAPFFCSGTELLLQKHTLPKHSRDYVELISQQVISLDATQQVQLDLLPGRHGLGGDLDVCRDGDHHLSGRRVQLLDHAPQCEFCCSGCPSSSGSCHFKL